MPTRNINLTDQQDSFVATELQSGRYKNASEVVRAGLRLLEQREREDALKLEALRRDVQAGVDAYERSEFTSLNSAEEIEHFMDGIAKEADA